VVEWGAHTLAKAEVVEETEAAAEAYVGAGAVLRKSVHSYKAGSTKLADTMLPTCDTQLAKTRSRLVACCTRAYSSQT
jgi:hypothetical protein